MKVRADPVRAGQCAGILVLLLVVVLTTGLASLYNLRTDVQKETDSSEKIAVARVEMEVFLTGDQEIEIKETWHGLKIHKKERDIIRIFSQTDVPVEGISGSVTAFLPYSPIARRGVLNITKTQNILMFRGVFTPELDLSSGINTTLEMKLKAPLHKNQDKSKMILLPITGRFPFTVPNIELKVFFPIFVNAELVELYVYKKTTDGRTERVDSIKGLGAQSDEIKSIVYDGSLRAIITVPSTQLLQGQKLFLRASWS